MPTGKQAPVNLPPIPPGEPVPPPVPSVPPATVPVRTNRWRWWIHLLLMAAFPVVLGVMSLRTRELSGPALTADVRSLLTVCGVHLLVFGLVLGVALLVSRASRDDLLLRWRGGFWTVPIGLGYSIAIRFALMIAVYLVFAVLILSGLVSARGAREFAVANRPDVSTIVDISALRENPLYFVLMITLVSFVVAGLREELWRSAFLAGMRALWPERFGSRVGQIAAAAVAAVIFGIGHLAQGVIGAGAATLLGFGLGVIMVLHRSIWPAVIAHGAFDATTMALLPWAEQWLRQLRDAAGH